MIFTGWSIVRGFIAGTVKKKLGLPVITEKVEGVAPSTGSRQRRKGWRGFRLGAAYRFTENPW